MCQGYCWHDVRPECCDDVRSSDPGSGLDGLVSSHQLTHTSPPSALGPLHHPCPLSRPLRTCQTVSVLPWLNHSCELYHRPVHRQNSPKYRVQIICEIRVSVKHYRDICRLLGRIKNINFSQSVLTLEVVIGSSDFLHPSWPNSRSKPFNTWVVSTVTVLCKCNKNSEMENSLNFFSSSPKLQFDYYYPKSECLRFFCRSNCIKPTRTLINSNSYRDEYLHLHGCIIN